MSWIKEYLKSGTKQSSMRLTLIWAMVLVSLIILSISASIIVSVIIIKSIDWIGIAAALASLGAFIAPFLYFKKEQNKIENVQQKQQN